MAIFFIDLNKLKGYNENMFQVEQYNTKHNETMSSNICV